MLTDESPNHAERVNESKNSNKQLDDGLDPVQTEIIRLYRSKFHVKYGNEASPKEIFSSAGAPLDWPVFLVGWPAAGFRILELQNIFGEVDYLFVDEGELERDGILTPFFYFGDEYEDRMDTWHTRIDMLIQGVGSGSSKLYGFRNVAQNRQHAGLCREIAEELELMDEPIKSRVHYVLQSAQERSQILTESLETLDRISTIRREARAAKEAREAGRWQYQI